MKKNFIFFVFIFIFIFSFGHIYQKTKIVTLAYGIHDKKVLLNRLEEKNSSLLYSFYEKVNVQSLHDKMKAEGLQLTYPKKYVKITPVSDKDVPASGRVSLVAKILGVGSQVEAQP
jgi:uncharacterized protein (UPF0128 family)